MLTHSMSTLHILRMLMHFSSGHVTLPPGEFHNSEIFPPIGVRALGGLTLGFAPNFQFSSGFGTGEVRHC